MYAKIRRENLTSARYTISKTRKRFYYAEVRIMASTMDVDDRSDSDDDEEIVERGAFNALVVVVLMCALHKSYTHSFFSFWSSTREREKGGDRNEFFFFCIQRQRTNSKKRNASFDCFRTRSVSFSLQLRAARTTLRRRESVDRWWKMDFVNLCFFSSLCCCCFVCVRSFLL